MIFPLRGGDFTFHFTSIETSYKLHITVSSSPLLFLPISLVTSEASARHMSKWKKKSYQSRWWTFTLWGFVSFSLQDVKVCVRACGLLAVPMQYNFLKVAQVNKVKLLSEI